MSEENKRKPFGELRIGPLKTAVWRNENEKGPWYNVSFERRYGDRGEWKTSSSFGRDDLLPFAKLAD